MDSVVEALALVISILAMVVSAWTALRQVAVSKESNALPVVIDMFREYRSPEFREHLAYVYQRLRDEHEPHLGYYGLPEPARTHVTTVSFFFDNLGHLVANDIVDEDLVIGFLGGATERVWQILNPYVEGERKQRREYGHNNDAGYQEYFEDLACRVQKNKPSAVRRNLQSIKQATPIASTRKVKTGEEERMPKKDNTEGFPELLKQLADGFSIHTQIAARYWLALALVSAFTIMPNPEKGDLMLPFLEVGAEQLDYYSFSFVVISLLIIGYGSAHCQAIRTRMLAQKYIDSSETTFLNSSGIHVQDVLDCIMSPSITRVAPLVQILQGRQQFFEKKACDRSRLRWLLAIYFLVLRLVGVLALYVFPGYALARTFILGGLFHSSIRTSGIPVYLLWPFGIVAMLVLVQLFMTDLYYFRRAAGRICNNQSKERS